MQMKNDKSARFLSTYSTPEPVLKLVAIPRLERCEAKNVFHNRSFERNDSYDKDGSLPDVQNK